MTLPGQICFDCELAASREVANDMDKINRYLECWWLFDVWLIEHSNAATGG